MMILLLIVIMIMMVMIILVQIPIYFSGHSNPTPWNSPPPFPLWVSTQMLPGISAMHSSSSSRWLGAVLILWKLKDKEESNISFFANLFPLWLVIIILDYVHSTLLNYLELLHRVSRSAHVHHHHCQHHCPHRHQHIIILTLHLFFSKAKASWSGLFAIMSTFEIKPQTSCCCIIYH